MPFIQKIYNIYIKNPLLYIRNLLFINIDKTINVITYIKYVINISKTQISIIY